MLKLNDWLKQLKSYDILAEIQEGYLIFVNIDQFDPLRSWISRPRQFTSSLVGLKPC